MKSMILMLHLLLGAPDYETMELVIDLQIPIEHCELYYIDNDKLYQEENPEVIGSRIVLHLKQYRDYELVVNHHTILSITPMSDDIRDEQDLSISAETNYNFRKGILVFEIPEFTSK